MSYRNIENHMVCYTHAEHEARFGGGEVSEETTMKIKSKESFMQGIDFALCQLRQLEPGNYFFDEEIFYDEILHTDYAQTLVHRFAEAMEGSIGSDIHENFQSCPFEFLGE